MDDDPQDIYEAPSEASALTSFQQIRKAFEAQRKVPIKVATDGRHKSNESDTAQIIKPRPSIRPKPGTGLGQNFLEQNTKPGLPVKKFLKPMKNDQQPPLPAKSGVPDLPAKANVFPKPRTPSIRDTMFPPVDEVNTIQPNSPNDLLRRNPLTPINGHNVSPTPGDHSIVTSKNGKFKRKDLPSAAGGPPSKPPKLSINISFEEFGDLRNASPEPPEPDEVYDDIERPEPPKKPPPKDDGGGRVRPVSMIPEMTEDEELDKEVLRKKLMPVNEQEVYDDVAHDGSGEAEAEAEEIYEDI